MINRTPSGGYKQEPGFDRIVDGKIYIGIVKNNEDARKSGRLEVWIPEMGGDPKDRNKWHIVQYASPFAGVSNIEDNTMDSQKWEQSQRSYGFWAVPPDLDNQVLCCFVNGEASKGYWFACLWAQNMNHMVPGIASNISYEDGEEGALPPVVEYNKKQSKDGALDINNPKRPRFEPLHNGLKAQGLYKDSERGPASTSARRDSPSKAFGMLSPRGQQLYIDDEPSNEFIRFRTRSGVQILIHETNGYIYMNTRNGNSWLELSDLGIDVYSRGPISMRTEADFNVRADKSIHFDAGENIQMRAGKSLLIRTNDDVHVLAKKDIRFTAGADLHLKAVNITQGASGAHSTKGSDIFRDGQISDNNGKSSDALKATPVTVTTQRDYKNQSRETTVTRMPHHEPWGQHPKAGQTADTPKTSAGSSGSSPKPLGTKTLDSVPQTRVVTTGDGTKVTKEVPMSGETIEVNGFKVPKEVEAAIAKGAAVTGVDYGYMMAMAAQESGFDPNAKAKTSSASGLYQFTDGTWKTMVDKYGAQHGITLEDKANPEAQAIMAGYLTKENQNRIERATGKSATPGELYMGHFMGGGGASKFLAADPGASAVEVAGNKAATANRNIFYNRDGSPRTVAEVTTLLSGKIDPKVASYNGSKPTLA